MCMTLLPEHEQRKSLTIRGASTRRTCTASACTATHLSAPMPRVSLFGTPRARCGTLRSRHRALHMLRGVSLLMANWPWSVWSTCTNLQAQDWRTVQMTGLTCEERLREHHLRRLELAALQRQC